jgi:hypothetical protein
VPNNVFMSPRAVRLSCSAILMLVLCVLPATASASAGQTGPAVAHSARSAQRAQARAEHKLQREARRAAHQAQRSTRQAEREERRATRAAQRAQRSGVENAPSESPVQEAPAAPEGKPEAPSTGPEATPSTTAHGRCSLSAESSAQQVTAGEAVTISGKLTCPSVAEAGEQEVTIYQREAGGATSDLKVAATATTEEDGSYKIQSAALNGRSVFIVRAAPVPHGARVIVTVDSAVILQGPTANAASLPMGAGRAAGGPVRATFIGTIEPAQGDRQVGLKIRYGQGEWRTVSFTRTDAEGHFTFSHRFRYAGDVTVMAVARARGTQRTQSQPLAYTVAQAQNPALTITSSPMTPALAEVPAGGAQTTIAGVASGQAHQTVTLLSHTSAGHFTSVATTQSDQSGDYAFTVQPTQTTIYKVSCAKARSTPLRLEVS